jgi:hypothetical protein
MMEIFGVFSLLLFLRRWLEIGVLKFMSNRLQVLYFAIKSLMQALLGKPESASSTAYNIRGDATSFSLSSPGQTGNWGLEIYLQPASKYCAQRSNR